MVMELLTPQEYDRDRFARSFWQFDLLIYQLRPGLRRMGENVELVFYGIPISFSQERIVISCQEYYLWAMNNGREDELRPGKFFYSNRKINMQWIKMIYLLTKEFGKYKFGNNEWKRLETQRSLLEQGVCYEDGWPCDVYIEREPLRRMTIISERKKNIDSIKLVITDKHRIEIWEGIFPSFLVYDQERLKSDLKIEEVNQLYSIIWDGCEIEDTCRSFLAFLYRFLRIAEIIIFLKPGDAADDMKQKSLGMLIGHSDFNNVVLNVVREKAEIACKNKWIYEFSIENSKQNKRKLLENLMKMGVNPGILTLSVEHRRRETQFLERYFPSQWISGTLARARDEKNIIFLMTIDDIYSMDINHYIVNKEDFSAEYRQKVICESQSRGTETIICIYRID